MKTAADLKTLLTSIDHRSYPAYKECRGQYHFKDYMLSIDHVQGDPFASPSRLSIHISKEKAEFPSSLSDTKAKRTVLADHLIRLFSHEIEKFSFRAKGSGKSGLISVSRCGQEILERTCCSIVNGAITLRLEIGFPANGRTIHAKELIKILYIFLPDCIQKSLYWNNIDQKKLIQAIRLCEDQEFIRSQLSKLGLCAFLANGSILPRVSGVSDKPMKDAAPFISPASMEITLNLPNRGTITGMGIKKGITLFVGGGYHGKSTLLRALELGVYNHIDGDGREFVITDPSALKLRAEDGRSINHVNISPFINHLPNKKDTMHFSTEDASGSTSQAAALLEGVESGSSLLLIDEDTSATNFMIRDELMQRVISKGEEPITPFIERVRSLYEDWNVSSILVAGSSGSYFHVADTIIQMKNYVPYDITDKAKSAAKEFPAVQTSSFSTAPSFSRFPKANSVLKKDDRLKIKVMGTSSFSLNKDSVELRYLEQLVDSEQTAALANLLQYAELHLMDGKRSMTDIVNSLESLLEEKGLEGLFENGTPKTSLSRPRRQEIFACINRYRKLIF